jgi:hypothetical protein
MERGGEFSFRVISPKYAVETSAETMAIRLGKSKEKKPELASVRGNPGKLLRSV